MEAGMARRLALAMAMILGLALPAVSQAQRPYVRQVFLGDSEDGACQRRRHAFDLGALRELYVCVAYHGIAGTYVQRLTFRTPDGEVYQVVTRAFSTPGADPVSQVVVDGRTVPVTPLPVPTPEELDRRVGRPGDVHVVTELPVAGTHITQHNLTGGWLVEVSLNGQLLDREHFVLRR
jgi:hypothetical protein